MNLHAVKAIYFFEMHRWVRTIVAELPHADVVHVRGPAHIALVAMLMLPLVRRPAGRWIKFAGNWRTFTVSGA